MEAVTKSNKRRAVSDEEMRAALADPNVRDLMKAEAFKYRRVLSDDQRESAAYCALWRCLGYHVDGKGLSLTSNLHRHLNWELRRELKKERRRTGHGIVRWAPEAPDEIPDRPDEETDGDGAFTREQLEDVSECMDRFLPRAIARAVRSHYVDNRSVEEVAKAEGWPREAARRRIAFGVTRLREICGEDV